jgi:hypothetical protein
LRCFAPVAAYCSVCADFVAGNSRIMSQILRFVLVTAALGATLSLSSIAEGATISNTQLESNFNGGTGAGQTAPIAANPFDFTGQLQLSSIQSISITMTMIDGDTGLGPNGAVDTPYPPDGNQHGDDDFDVNSLSLQLDGIDLAAQLLLNGFNSYDPSAPLAASDFVTLTITGTPSASQAAAILAALQNGTLVANVLDSTGVASSNGFEIPNTQIDHTTQIFTTLSITGTPVPEPATFVLLGCGLLVVGLRAVKERT